MPFFQLNRRCIFLTGLFFLLLSACQPPGPALRDLPLGKLYIIGGGKRPPEMVREIIRLSGLDTRGYAVVLPMASAEPDTAAYYGRLQFIEAGIPPERLLAWSSRPDSAWAASTLDSLLRARLIYITGGDQARFMASLAGTELKARIRRAYREGATVAGTSAGAAVMGRLMITGNEFKHPEYTGEFRTIEAENVEVVPGLGLLPRCIVDQHFVYRMRMNRLLSVALEQPDQLCLGIDESTALVVEGDSARVSGIGQVIALRPGAGQVRRQNGLLGGKNMSVSVLLPGDRLALPAEE